MLGCVGLWSADWIGVVNGLVELCQLVVIVVVGPASKQQASTEVSSAT